MRLILLSLVSLGLTIGASAQYLGFNGLTVRASATMEDAGKKASPSDTDQLFAFSFADNTFTHIILDGANVNSSQVYEIQEQSSYMDGDVTVYELDALSGLSGSVYHYELRIEDDGTLAGLYLTQPDGYRTKMTGGISELKTFKQ